jgi:murein L,D-transpeptidase YafK
MSRKTALAILGLAVMAVTGSLYEYGRSLWVPVYYKIVGKRTVEDILEQYGTPIRNQLRVRFENAKVEYTPSRIVLLATKQEQRLEVWAVNGSKPTLIHSYPILGLSGESGPKLKEGDSQVPEGIYRIVDLNPNSSFHLSLKLNYPNEFDLVHAAAENRRFPGGNIFIHGNNMSVGCLAMGDKVAEELFILAADLGPENISVVIAPHDPRRRPLSSSGQPKWVQTLYQKITDEFRKYQIEGST